MSLPLLKSLFAHTAWANARVLDALRNAPGDDPHALGQFAHLLAAEHVWLARIEKRRGNVPVWPVLTLDECAALAEENARAYARFLEGETEGSIVREFDYTNSAAHPFTGRLSDVLAHVALHGSYHRGQISLMMRPSGGHPAPTDFILFTREPPAFPTPSGGTR